MRKPLAGPAPLSMCEDHLHLTVVLSLQLEFKISMRSMHLFEVDGKKLDYCNQQRAHLVARQYTARQNLDRSDLWLRDLSMHIYVPLVFSEEAANVSLGRPQGEIKPHNR